MRYEEWYVSHRKQIINGRPANIICDSGQFEIAYTNPFAEEEQDYNARLIAAAPKLLEVRIIEILSKVPSPDPLYEADMITLQGDVDVLAKFNDMGVK